MLWAAIGALSQSYDYLVLDAGAQSEIALASVAATAPYAVLVGGDTPANALTALAANCNPPALPRSQSCLVRRLCSKRPPHNRRHDGASVAGFKYKVFRATLNTLYFSGVYRALRPLMGGVGAILMLHHVRPSRSDRFQPNHLLEVTPRFFETVIRRLRRSKVDLISLDEMHRRLTTGDYPRRRFVCVTFDDGYRDNLQFAYPVLKKYEVPFTIYVATSFADRIGELWWLALEAVIAQNDMIGMHLDGRDRWFECRSVADKRQVYDHIYGWLRQRPYRGGTAADRARSMCTPPRRHVGILRRISAWDGTNSRRSPPTRW
jgi:hypothetical protein